MSLTNKKTVNKAYSKKPKKAQSGSQAAIVVIIIAAALIIYILALPPEVRHWLLENTTTNQTQGLEGNLIEELLDESPGLLSTIATDFKSITIPSFALRITTSGKVIKQLPNALIIHGIFTNKPKTIDFKVDNPPLTNNLRLSFNIKQASGRLVIRLNDEEIFNSKLKKGSPTPIELPSDLIKGDNQLIFSVSGPGIAFWRVNQYEIENILITATITDVTGGESIQQVVLGNSDIENLDRSEISMIVDCSEAKGLLTITLNGNQAFEAVPDCGSITKIAVQPTQLHKGINIISFKSEQDYTINNPRLKLYFTEPNYPTYYFDIDDKYFNDINTENEALRSQYKVKLVIEFTNPDVRKQLELTINGRKFSVDVFKTHYEKDISQYVYSGINSLKLKPLKDVEVSRLKVLLYKP